MKRRGRIETCRGFLGILLLTLCCLFVSGRAFAEENVTELQMQGTITTDTLNVRSGPGKDYDVVTKISGDTVLTITGQADNGWYRIEIDGTTGYVSDQYVSAQEVSDETQEQEPEAGEPEEGYRGLESPYLKKLLILGAAICIVLVMIVLTIRGMRRDDEDDDEDEDEDETDEDEDEYGAGEKKEEEDGGAGRAAGKRSGKERARGDGRKSSGSRKREYVLREEDYRVQIDPSFFEDREPIEQPAMVTGYLERKRIEEEALRKGIGDGTGDDADKQKELDEAMAKLNELQQEIERLKKR